jgi:hypothetical protein
MIDFIKLRVDKVPDNILNNPGLKFDAPTCLQTGEVKVQRNGYINQTAMLGDMRIDYIENINTKKKQLELSGSIHRYFHHGINHNDFNLNELSISIDSLCAFLGINPKETKLHRLEFGVNIATEHKTKQILNSIICYMGKPFELRRYKGKGYLKRFPLHQYDIKIYDKALKCDLEGNILRFEVSLNRMDFILKKGVHIVSIADLLKPKVHKQLRTILVNTIANLLFIDYRINHKRITNQFERENYLIGVNPNFWETYRENHSAKGYKMKMKRFKQIVSNHAPSNLKSELLELILGKWDQLISTPILPSVIKTKVPQYYIHIVGKDRVLNKRYCISCGREITKQKKDSRFCGEKYRGRNGKNCRNLASNFKQHELRFYPNPTLFDVDVYLPPNYQLIKSLVLCS